MRTARIPTCHPDRKHDAKGLCHSCYMMQWMKAHPNADTGNVWLSKRPERRRELMAPSQRKYRESHREEAKVYGRAYYAANRERIRDRGRKQKYGLTQEAFLGMLALQKNLCGLCGKPLSDNHSLIAVDHDHVTGRIRGLVHRGCNVAIAAYENWRDAVEVYLRRHSARV